MNTSLEKRSSQSNVRFIDENERESLLNRYHLREINGENNDLLQYLSDDDQDDENRSALNSDQNDFQYDYASNPLRGHRDDQDDNDTDEDDF